MRPPSYWLVCLLIAIVGWVAVEAGKDYYAILDVPRDASKNQIKKHYKKLSRVYHPDKNPGDTKASAKFMELSDAYSVLSDDEKRTIYDRYGEEGLEQHRSGGGGGGFQNPFDMFSQFFGGGGGHHGHAQERRGPDMQILVDVTLEDLYNGATVDIDISKQVLCDHCHGSGAHRSEDIVKCPVCHGRGVTLARIQLAPGMVQQIQQTCEKCGGEGKIIQHVCSVCGGKKVRRANEQQTIHIEKGMKNGDTVVLEQEADEYPDAIPGDVIFVISTVPHPIFERRGHSLYTKQSITLIQALTGFKKTLTHLDGTTVTLKREGVTQYGFVQSLPGYGMPHRDSSARGDLFVEYTVIFPTHVDPETVQGKYTAFPLTLLTAPIVLRKGIHYAQETSHQEL
ncbi:hypothetical protein BDF14DRAFT_1032213 [Spinellus fusiger]|nr:hypothetical protein BDF14DRAFT_1032213 [Spinellus fusiger]